MSGAARRPTQNVRGRLTAWRGIPDVARRMILSALLGSVCLGGWAAFTYVPVMHSVVENARVISVDEGPYGWCRSGGYRITLDSMDPPRGLPREMVAEQCDPVDEGSVVRVRRNGTTVRINPIDSPWGIVGLSAQGAVLGASFSVLTVFVRWVRRRTSARRVRCG